MNASATIKPDLQAAALGYAAKDLPVFPCDPRDKSPLTERGLHDASTDEATVRQWWARWPEAMIGMPTGSRTGFWALDVDDPAAFEAARPQGYATRRNDTGKGYHYLFKCDPAKEVRNRQRHPKRGWPFPELPGAETRGEGGYIIVPPSVHPSGKIYQWHDGATAILAPAELLSIVRKERSEQPGSEGGDTHAQSSERIRGNDTAYGLAALNAECEAIRAAGDGEQEAALNEAALKIGALVAGRQLTRETAGERLLAAALAMTSFDPRNPWSRETIERKIDRCFADGARNPRAAPQRSTKGKGPSEDDVALAFTELHHDRLRFDHDQGAWFEWDGTRWRKDGRHRAFTYARVIGRQMEAAGKANFAAGVERFARADEAHAVDASVWDKDLMLLGTPAGVVNLRTAKLSSALPEQHITKLTSCAPADGAPELWLKFLRESLAGDADTIRFIQQWFGYCLTGRTSAHALLFIYGPGGNGKSVLLNTLIAILGDYAVTAAMETFTASKFDRHSTELAMLRGARLVTASETEEGRAWAEARIKQLTGGDPITARFMRQDNFTFTPQFKLTIAGNHAPQLANVDDAMRRRFNIVPFINKPAAPDRQLEEKLRAEHGQILAWAIEGCLDWQANGLVQPTAVTEATASYFEEQDLFGQWIAERCAIGRDHWELATPLFNSWRDFARDAGDEAGSMKSFSGKLGTRGFRKGRASGGLTKFSGLVLRRRSEASEG